MVRSQRPGIYGRHDNTDFEGLQVAFVVMSLQHHPTLLAAEGLQSPGTSRDYRHVREPIHTVRDAQSFTLIANVADPALYSTVPTLLVRFAALPRSYELPTAQDISAG